MHPLKQLATYGKWPHLAQDQLMIALADHVRAKSNTFSFFYFFLFMSNFYKQPYGYNKLPNPRTLSFPNNAQSTDFFSIYHFCIILLPLLLCYCLAFGLLLAPNSNFFFGVTYYQAIFSYCNLFFHFSTIFQTPTQDDEDIINLVN